MSFCTLWLQSCYDTEEEKVSEINEALYSDENLYTLLDIYSDILIRMGNADIDKLENAFNQENNEEIKLLLNYADTEIEEIFSNMQVAVSNLINKYPEVNELLNNWENKDCKKCNTDMSKAFQYLKKDNFNPVFLNLSPMTRNGSESGCGSSGGLVGCLIACAVAPVTVWAYPACCAFCYYVYC